ncbi:hypothetical protein F4779DRAFT_597321 [Xylariaceae sp. FL0662B]|nr:hypothetical protein F4779DRAFT_597321 [Xylariaceae sp. FL0662B]
MAELEACYALGDLQRKRLDIFPRTELGEDKYLIFIPLAWTACASLQTNSVCLSVHGREMDPVGTDTSAKPTPETEFLDGDGPATESMKSVLGRYVSHVLRHPAVMNSPKHMQTRLVRELKTVLLAHIDHAEDNRRFAVQLAENLYDSALPCGCNNDLKSTNFARNHPQECGHC